MGQALYADRKDKLDELHSLLLYENRRFICYRGEPGYGMTSFFHRFCYLLQSTEDMVCLFAELSENSRSPLHSIMKKIVLKEDGNLYQSIQLFTDEQYGEYEKPLLKSVILDLSGMGETLSHILLDKPKALPIYSGYYPDVLKNIFFELIKKAMANKTVIIIIDGAQFIDSSAFYDILALSEMDNVKIVFAQTEESPQLSKLFLEISIQKEQIKYLDFPKPPIDCVREIWEYNHKKISNSAAQILIQQTKGNIREIVYAAMYGASPQSTCQGLLASEILSLIYILDDSIPISDLVGMIRESPTCSMYEEQAIRETVHGLVDMGLLLSLFRVDREELLQPRIRRENQKIWDSLLANPADTLIYQDIVLRYLESKPSQSFEELKKLFELAKSVAPQHGAKWAKRLLMEALRSGNEIKYDWINIVKSSMPDPENQFLCAIATFREWKYTETLDILTPIWPQIRDKRDAQILYALTLNRCREHKKADKLLWSLINSSSDIDERAILLSIAISNSVHGGNESKAAQIVSDYGKCIVHSKKYGYFLRNSATLFQGDQALNLWEKSLKSFQEADDEYGELTTIVNMSRAFIRNGATQYARERLEYAYTGLLPYGMSQLHIAANNLAIAHLECSDFPNAKRYLRIARLIAKSIMPKTYITINECCILLEQGCTTDALELLLEYKDAINATNIPRLKGRYFLALAGSYRLLGRFDDAIEALDISDKYSTVTFKKLRKNIRNQKPTSSYLNWRDFFAPAFLEYWIANPLGIMSADALPV